MLIALITIALLWIAFRILLFFVTLPFKILGILFGAPVFVIVLIILIILIATSVIWYIFLHKKTVRKCLTSPYGLFQLTTDKQPLRSWGIIHKTIWKYSHIACWINFDYKFFYLYITIQFRKLVCIL